MSPAEKDSTLVREKTDISKHLNETFTLQCCNILYRQLKKKKKDIKIYTI